VLAGAGEGVIRATVDGKEVWVEGPVHGAFGLTYASYLVWPRSIMEDMPLDWQERFVALADELNAAFCTYEPPGGYTVTAKGEGGRIVKDPFREYRRPDRDAIARARC
jgi:hypothetical protein